MDKIKELTEEIQSLENYYAECLGGNENHETLYTIWKKIKELRQQLHLYESELSSAGRN